MQQNRFFSRPELQNFLGGGPPNPPYGRGLTPISSSPPSCRRHSVNTNGVQWPYHFLKADDGPEKTRFPRRFLAPGLFGRFRETSFLPGLPVRFGTAKITIIYGQISSDLCQRLNGLIVWQTNRHTPTKRSDAQPLVEREKQFECLPVEISRS